MLKRKKIKKDEKKSAKKKSRVCQKCGCELRSKSKEELCVNCIKEKNKKVRAGAVGVAGGVIAVAPVIIKAAPKVIATVGKIIVKK